MKKQITKARKNKKGFTLIELIVVIAILGILAAILIPQFTGFQDNARKKTVMSEASSVLTAVNAYRADNGEYTTDVQDLVDGGYITTQLSANASALNADGGFTYTNNNYTVTIASASDVIDAASVVEVGAAPTEAG